LLYETSEPLLGKLSFVIQDARLGHTLSRDNVRRDDNFERALQFVRDLGKTLPTEIVHQMHQQLLLPNAGDFQALAHAVYARGIAIDLEDWPLPLMDPVNSKVVTSIAAFRDAGSWTANRRSALSAAMASAKIPVVDRRALIDPWFFEVCGAEQEVHGHLTLVTPVARSGSDLALIDMLGEVLDHVFRSPSKIILAQLEGAYDTLLSVAGGPESAFVGASADQPWILDNEGAKRNPFRVLRRPALVLNVAAPGIRVARQKATTAPYVAAATLARLILLEHGVLDEDRSEKMLSHGLETLLGESL
jgi:molecular chaperone HtpG